MDFLVHHLLRTTTQRAPGKEAIVHGKQRLTYGEVAGQTAGLAQSLRQLGLQSEERIGIWLGPSAPQVLSIFAVAQAGGAFVPINDALFPNQVAHIVNDCRVKGLITDQAKLAALHEVIDSLPSLEFVIVVHRDPLPTHSLPLYSFAALCATPAPTRWQDWGIEKSLAAILYTSGSTGKPKGIMLSHANIMAGASIVATYLGISEVERILAVLPFSFDAGLNQLTTAFRQGGTIVLTTFVFARELVQVLLKEQITGLAGVPTLWSLLAQPSSGFQKNQFPDLRYITNTGGAMPQNVLALLRQALPATKIFLMYGLTEAFRSTYLAPEELASRPTSIGKAIPNTEILVVNEQGQLCQPGEIGELVHRGPTVSLGYWGHPILNEQVFRPHPLLPPEQASFERVCYSGDLVKLDEEGFLYFIGRRDTMIKSSGYRISPTEVEEILFQSGKVRGAAVIGLPDPLLGQQVKAFVVPKDGEILDPAQLMAFCAERLPRYMAPKCIEVIQDLPKTSSGKVNYPALHQR